MPRNTTAEREPCPDDRLCLAFAEIISVCKEFGIVPTQAVLLAADRIPDLWPHVHLRPRVITLDN
jgi:hypothetical protein